MGKVYFGKYQDTKFWINVRHIVKVSDVENVSGDIFGFSIHLSDGNIERHTGAKEEVDDSHASLIASMQAG